MFAMKHLRILAGSMPYGSKFIHIRGHKYFKDVRPKTDFLDPPWGGVQKVCSWSKLGKGAPSPLFNFVRLEDPPSPVTDVRIISHVNVRNAIFLHSGRLRAIQSGRIGEEEVSSKRKIFRVSDQNMLRLLWTSCLIPATASSTRRVSIRLRICFLSRISAFCIFGVCLIPVLFSKR